MSEDGQRTGWLTLTDAQWRSFVTIFKVLAGVYGTGWLLLMLLPSSVQYLALDPGRMSEPWFWYTIVTYATLHSPVVYLLGMLVLSGLSLLIVLRYLNASETGAFLVVAVVMGGALYAVIPESGAMVLGSRFATWALGGAALGCWLRDRHNFERTGNAIVLILAVVLAFALLDRSPSGFTAVLMAVAGAVYTAWAGPWDVDGVKAVAVQE